MSGMFGAKPDWGSAIQAGIGGWLSAGGVPGGSQLMNQAYERRRMAQQQAMEEANYTRQRQDGMQDWIAKQAYQAAHPQPHINDTVADYEFIRQQLGDEGAKRFLETKTNPIVMTPYGPMPYSSVAPPQAAKPLTDEDILRMQGGPTPQASGGFSGPY